MKKKQIEKKDEFTEKIMAGLEKVYEKLIQFKKQKNSELIVMKDGKIARIKP
ncbi:MAG: hypothetical protein KGV44_06180 [Flavobacteriaceae bacterium]|nr:hypothetical protein [Flavobacteriaceae bacterium]